MRQEFNPERRYALKALSILGINAIVGNPTLIAGSRRPLEKILQGVDFDNGINLNYEVDAYVSLFWGLKTKLNCEGASLNIDGETADFNLNLSICPIKIKQYRKDGSILMSEKIKNGEEFYIRTEDGWSLIDGDFVFKNDNVFTGLRNHLYNQSGNLDFFLKGRDYSVNYKVKKSWDTILLSADISKLELGGLKKVKAICACKNDYLIPHHIELNGTKLILGNYTLKFDLI